jgi:hypothetical protein
VVVAPTLNLREGPGTGYPVVGDLSGGDELYVTGQYQACAWLNVSTADQTTGWVSGANTYVDLAQACDAFPDGIFRPLTGIIKPNTRGGGMGELSVENGTDTDGLVIMTMSNDEPVMAAYVRAGETVRMTGIADGTYVLFFSKGQDWNGNAGRFMRNVRYQRFEDAFPYSTTATTYTIWSVTLHGVVGGSASTESVDPDQFPDLGP